MKNKREHARLVRPFTNVHFLIEFNQWDQQVFVDTTTYGFVE